LGSFTRALLVSQDRQHLFAPLDSQAWKGKQATIERRIWNIEKKTRMERSTVEVKAKDHKGIGDVRVQKARAEKGLLLYTVKKKENFTHKVFKESRKG
jgi:hypothetical protein